MSGPDLQIGAIVIALDARLKIEQTYRALDRRADQRTAAGSGVRWSLWGGKLATDIRLEGFVPAGLAALDVGTSHLLRCAVPRAIDSDSRVIEIPAARRSGALYAPLGLAEVRGELVATPVALVGNTATLDAVADASLYRVHYWPEFTAWLTVEDERLDTQTGRYRYALRAAEV